MSVSVSQAVIHHAAAHRCVHAALAKAESLSIRVCVSVVDSAAHPAAFARMPGAFLISGDLASSKAKAAASVGLPADVVEQVLAQEAPRVREGIVRSGHLLIRGGLPLRDGEHLIGAVGVSGGSESQDVECAQAAVDALLASTSR